MTQTNFGIIGYGIVGKATHLSLLKELPVTIYDIKDNNTKLKDVFDCDFTFVCIPTRDQSDIKLLVDIVSQIHKHNKENQIVIRSTIPIGTSARIKEMVGCEIIYMPEFLRENHWQEDCKKRPILLGSDNIDLPEWLKDDEVIGCSLSEAEIVKMMCNAYNSLRVVFANHFSNISEFCNSNYDNILELFQIVSPKSTYLNIPGPDNRPGFGGKCLPKDLVFLIQSMNEMSIDQNLFASVLEDNKKWRQ
jgi:UDPglucose 6-dehydrogenase